MTALDQAFIKAYAQESTGPRSAPQPDIQKPDAVKRDAAADTVVALARGVGASALAGGPQSASNQPLTLFSGQEGSAPGTATTVSPSDAMLVHPTYEVDQVVWPEFCTVLSSEIGDQLDALVNQLQHDPDGSPQAIGLLGLNPASGCTTATLTLAHHICQRQNVAGGAQLLVVDASPHGSYIAQSLGLAPQASWSEVGAGRGALGDALIESLEDRLVIMPIAGEQRGAGEELDYQRLFFDMETLVAQHETTLVDLGTYAHAFQRGTIQALAGCLDSVLLIHDVQAHAEDQVQHVIAELDKLGVNVVGVVENRTHESTCATLVA